MISFIIPAFNAEKTIDKCIKSVLKQDVEKEIIVVDNNSTDTTYEISKKFHVNLLKEEKKGAAAARNRGLDAAKGDYIAFVDADVVLTPDWAQKALKKLDGEIIAAGGPGKSVKSGVISQSLDTLLFGKTSNSADTYVNSIATMNGLYKTDAIGRGRFDEKLLRGQDPEFNFRLRKKGHKLLYSKDLIVLHYHPESLKDLIKKWFNYGIWYPLPYLKHKKMIGPLFLIRVLFIPVLLGFFALSIVNKLFIWLALLQITLLFSAYVFIGLGRARGALLLVFPFVHTIKQLSQVFGIFVGFIKRLLQ